MAKADATQAIEAYLDKLYAGTKIADKDFRLGLLDKTTAQIAATKDSMVVLALAARPAVPGEPRGDEEAAGRADARFARATCRPCSRRRAASSRRTRTARCASPSAP